MILVWMSIQVKCNVTFPIAIMFFSTEDWESWLLWCHLAEIDTLSLFQRACSSMTASVKWKHCFTWSARFITTEPLWLSSRLKVQFSFWPLDGPFNQEIPPPPLFCYYRHHSPQNGWQLLEIPGCVTTLEVHTLCHLCSTCFDASAAREAEKHHASNSTSSQLRLEAATVSIQG